MSTIKNKVAIKRSNEAPGATLDFQEKERKNFRFKTRSIPLPSIGQSFVGVKKLVVPDQSMSLQEILTRFTRGEAVPIGKDGSFDEHADTNESIDLEKIAKADLVDREEYHAKLQETRDRYEKQEKAKEAAKKKAQEKAAHDEFIRKIDEEVEKRTKAAPKGSA